GRTRHARRRPARRAARREPGRAGRRTRPARQRPARADRPRSHAGLAALGQGARMGRGVRCRADRLHAAHSARHDTRAGGRGAPADAQGAPPFVVFSDATLVAIADARPSSPAELARISGVGPTKLTRYAQPLLEVIGGADPAEVAPVEID